MNESDSRAQRIGFVGVGRMGANMARRLRDRGRRVAVVFDADAAVAADLAREIGAEVAPDLAAVADGADVIFTVVADDAGMADIFADDALLAGAAGRVFVNCATLTPAVHEETERRVRAAGGRTIEACMASSIAQARGGELVLIVAGEAETFEEMRPLLDDLGTIVRYVGTAGTAARVKALVNMVMNANACALAEGLGLGDALALDLATLRELFAVTGAASRVLETDAPDMVDREYDVYFSAAHAGKDAHIALALARGAGVSAPIAEAAAGQFDRLLALGLGELDRSSVAELTFPARLAERRAKAGADALR